MALQAALQRNGVSTQRRRVSDRHRVNVAYGAMECTGKQTLWVEVTSTGATSKRLFKEMILGKYAAYSGTVAAISREYWAARSPVLATASEATDPTEEPHVHTANVPAGLPPRVLLLPEKLEHLWSRHLGSITATEHRIVLNPGSKPVRINPYWIDPRTRELIKVQVGSMLKLKVIEPNHSAWASPVFLIPKPDGSHRFRIECRKLKERTVRASYPLPRIDDFLDALGDAQFFSTLDCSAGYWKILIYKGDNPKTAFMSHCGTYQCTSLPFGFISAPATFQCGMT